MENKVKRIGYLPRKISNSLWNDFKPLLNKFYDLLKSGTINLDENEQKVYDDKSKFITIATTRPETMLGDTAIAVNPKDKKHNKLIGKMAIIPLSGRVIPIIGDDYA